MLRSWRTEQGYLCAFGRLLLLFFPLDQVLEILSDYEELFSAEKEQGAPLETSIRGARSPWTAVQTLLDEFPQGKRYFLKWTGFWTLALLSSVCFLLFMENGWFAFTALVLLSLFGLIHGWQVRKVERMFWAGQQPGKRWLLIHMLLFVLVVGMEAVIQYLLGILHTLPSSALYPIGRNMDRGYTIFQIAILALFLWMLKKTASSSILYYLGAVHAFGALLFIWTVKNVWRGMDLTIGPGAGRQDMMICLMEYGNCLCLAFVLAVSLKIWEWRRGR